MIKFGSQGFFIPFTTDGEDDMISLSGDGDDATLSKKLDPMSDENFKQLVSVENKVNSLEMKVSELSKEVSVIISGDLEKSAHQDQAIKSLQKRGKCLNEDLQKMLESLDAVQLMQDQLEARLKRKSVATIINKVLDKLDMYIENLVEWESSQNSSPLSADGLLDIQLKDDELKSKENIGNSSSSSDDNDEVDDGPGHVIKRPQEIGSTTPVPDTSSPPLIPPNVPLPPEHMVVKTSYHGVLSADQAKARLRDQRLDNAYIWR